MISHSKKNLCLILCLFIIGIFTTACGDDNSTSTNYPFYPIPPIPPRPQSVTLDSKVINQLYELGIFEKDYEHISELTEANIPATFTYNGIEYKITKIGEEIFAGCSLLTNVTIPEGVTHIGDKAFEDCSSLTSLTLPDSVTNIGEEAFENCSSLTSINIPEGVTSIRDEVFGDCSSLASINIPNNVTSIGNEAFSGCSSLTSITIPDGVTTIGDGAFVGCSSLTSIKIPKSVTKIGNFAFDYINNIEISEPQKQLNGYPWGALNVNGEPPQSDSSNNSRPSANLIPVNNHGAVSEVDD